jgi:hypothetical protein
MEKKQLFQPEHVTFLAEAGITLRIAREARR